MLNVTFIISIISMNLQLRIKRRNIYDIYPINCDNTAQGRVPSIIMLSTLLIGVSKVFLCTCLNHFNLFLRIFPVIRVTPSLSLNSWFLIRSINVCPHIHLSIRNSVTFILCSKIFFTGQYSVHYSRAGLIVAR